MAREDPAKVLKSILKELQKSDSKTGAMVGGIASLTGALIGFMKSTVGLGAETEKIGAKFSRSFEGFSKSAQELSESFIQPAHIYDAFIFELQANTLGHKGTNEALQALFVQTQATGENFQQLHKGLFAATVGTVGSIQSMKRLIAAVDLTSRAFNLSREQLVEALSSLSRHTLNLIAATGQQNIALQQTVVQLQGLIPDQRLFTQAVNNLSKQFTIEGLTESLVMGFPTEEILRGQLGTIEILTAILDQGSQATKLLSGQGRQLIFQQAALKGAFGDLASKVAIREQIIERALFKGIEDAATLTNKQLARQIDAKMREAAAQNKEFMNTFEMIKREIVRPLITRGAQFFKELKNLLGGEFGTIMQQFLLAVGNVVFFLAELLLKGIGMLAGFLGIGEIRDDITNATAVLDNIREAADRTAAATSKIAVSTDPDTKNEQQRLAAAMNENNKFSIFQLRAVNKNLVKVVEAVRSGNNIATRNGKKESGGFIQIREASRVDESVHMAR
jgi:hypothetical protein